MVTTTQNVTTTTAYRIDFYRRGYDEPVKTRTTKILSRALVMIDEWREWTNGTAHLTALD